jgi:hypothetical protein
MNSELSSVLSALEMVQVKQMPVLLNLLYESPERKKRIS